MYRYCLLKTLLGVHIDERLTWHEHIQNISKKGTGISGLRRVREFVQLSTLLTIYNSLIQLLFDYCDVVWDSLPAAGASILQKLQNRAARVITRQGYDIRSNEIRKTLNWKTLAEMRNIHILTMMYKILNNLAPNYLRDLKCLP
jgi:hypothetical protein